MPAATLFDVAAEFPPPAARRGCYTQQLAARAAAPFAGRQRDRVLECLRFHSEGLTRGQIARALGMRLQSVCARVSELLHASPAPLAFETGDMRVSGGDGPGKVVRAALR